MPRLHGKVPTIDEALTKMRDEHASHARPLRRLVELCSELAGPCSNTSELVAELQRLSDRLERDMRSHLEREEAYVFPAIEAHLSREEQAVIVRELRARRQAKT